jgi:hypothetical protein
MKARKDMVRMGTRWAALGNRVSGGGTDSGVYFGSYGTLVLLTISSEGPRRQFWLEWRWRGKILG